MTSDLRTAAQQALEVWDRPHGINYIDFRPYMDALRAALAEQDGTCKYCTSGCPACDARKQRKPLTEQQIWDAVQHDFVGGVGFFAKAVATARAIEKAHGIT